MLLALEMNSLTIDTIKEPQHWVGLRLGSGWCRCLRSVAEKPQNGLLPTEGLWLTRLQPRS
jgi:hypothetical protein